MIVKKPYAFLIKNFRIIHGFLFLTLLYICYKGFNIYNFFNDYVSLHFYESSINLTSKYINLLVFIILILSSLINLLIYFILRMKKKENRTYLYIFITQIILFIYYIYMYTVFKGLELKSMTAETVMAYRDISIIALIPEAIFALIILARTFGFNLKQFDFKKDLESIDIVQSDNEEIELSFGDNTYKIKRFFRKLLRLTKYFVVENKIIVIGFSSILALVLSLTIFLRINVYKKEYEEKQSILANALLYNVNTSYITSYGIDNKIINKNNKYLIVDININNNHIINYELTRETFTLLIEDYVFNPNFGYKKEFKDLGTLFEPMTIEANTNNNYIIVFEIDEKLKDKHFTLRIKNFEDSSLLDIDTKYKNIRIKPKDLDKIENKTNYNLVANVDLSDSLYKDLKIKISDYEIADTFKDKESILQNNTYKDVYYVVSPTSTGNTSNKSVLRLSNSIENTNDSISKTIPNVSTLIDKYGILKYNIAGKERTINIDTIKTKYNNNKYTYFEIPNEVKIAEKIELLLIIRGLKYTINLK